MRFLLSFHSICKFHRSYNRVNYDSLLRSRHWAKCILNVDCRSLFCCLFQKTTCVDFFFTTVEYLENMLKTTEEKNDYPYFCPQELATVGVYFFNIFFCMYLCTLIHVRTRVFYFTVILSHLTPMFLYHMQ